jgi:hypothetical protein
MSTQVLNQHLQSIAQRQGESWTVDIVEHSNSPECRYTHPADIARFASDYERLATYLT